MEQPIRTIVKSGKYQFHISDNTLFFDGHPYSRNFKIGGTKISDCVSVSVIYNNHQPSHAYIPHILYDPDCSSEMPLERGRCSIQMIKILLTYIHRHLPSITEVRFQDMSNIECATDDEKQMNMLPFRKKGTYIKPIELYYFSIAFNGKTWYENYFNARQIDEGKHLAYRTTIDNLLSSTDILSFARFVEFAQLPLDAIDELKVYYDKSPTLGHFFTSIPKHDRCRLVRDWISTFMSRQLNGVFSNSDWTIKLPVVINGGARNTRKYYCPKGTIRHNQTFRDIGVDPSDV